MEENNGENSGPLTSLPVDRLTPTDCNAARGSQKATPLRKLDDREKKNKKKNKKKEW